MTTSYNEKMQQIHDAKDISTDMLQYITQQNVNMMGIIYYPMRRGSLTTTWFILLLRCLKRMPQHEQVMYQVLKTQKVDFALLAVDYFRNATSTRTSTGNALYFATNTPWFSLVLLQATPYLNLQICEFYSFKNVYVENEQDENEEGTWESQIVNVRQCTVLDMLTLQGTGMQSATTLMHFGANPKLQPVDGKTAQERAPHWFTHAPSDLGVKMLPMSKFCDLILK